MSRPELKETVEATTTRDDLGAPAGVKVVVTGRSLDSGVIVRVGILVIATALILLTVEMLLQVKLDSFPRSPTEGEQIERQQWSNIATYAQLGSIVFPSLIAFFGFYLGRGDMRDAIAGSFLIAFIIILSQGVLLNVGLFENTAGSLREVLMTNFMGLLGTIALFYFGSEAVIRAVGQYSASRVGVASAGLGRDAPNEAVRPPADQSPQQSDVS